jgi:hypothetical protein
MPELTITSPYVYSRVDFNTFTMGNPMPESTLSPSQGLWIWPRVQLVPPSSLPPICDLGSLDKYYFGMSVLLIFNRCFLYMYVLLVFTIFCYLGEKIKSKNCSLFLLNFFLILKILSVTLFRDPKAAILTLKMHTGSRL